MHIDLLRPDDLARTAELHGRHLRLGLFPHLGEKFLRAYHASFADSPYGIALVARSGDHVAGTLLGTTSNSAHYRWVVRNRAFLLSLHGGIALLARPRIAWMFARSRMGRYARGLARHLRPRPPDPPAAAAEPVSVLSHVVTGQRDRGRGVGRRLVETFAAEARAHGAPRARLVTPIGGPGVPFFERLGCELVSERRAHDGQPLREYRLPLARAPHLAPAMDRPRRLAA